MKKTIKDIDVKGKRVIVRCDFNVPQNEGVITDDSRIKAALPTINYLLNNDAKVILMSHLGRPDGEANMKFTLKPVAIRLSELLNGEVAFISAPLVIDDKVKTAAASLKNGEVMLLENVRFRKEETKNGADFAKELASLAEIFVQEAFGTAHRAHSSTVGIADYLPTVSGFLIEKEVRFLGNAIENPQRPFVAIMGGAKVGDKIPVIENLLSKVDTLIIGGGMAYTFFKAMGLEVGTSILDNDSLELAKELIKKTEKAKVKLLLPIDVVAAKEFKNDTEFAVFQRENIPSNMMGVDIGPKTIKLFEKELDTAKTVFWNGPMGVFEMKNFEMGTFQIAKKLSEIDAMTIIGGGDSAAAVEQFGFADKMTHISTGGGASLEFMEGKVLPGIAVIQEK